MLTTLAALCQIFSVCVFPSYQLLVHITSCLCFSYCSFISTLCSYCSFLTISLLGSNHCISILLLFGPCFIAKICIEKKTCSLADLYILYEQQLPVYFLSVSLTSMQLSVEPLLLSYTYHVHLFLSPAQLLCMFNVCEHILLLLS